MKLISGTLCLLLATISFADDYPNKPVRVLVPFSPGSAMDVLVRLITPKLYEQMGQSFVVENKVGGGGRTGTEAGAKMPADGYNLLMTALGPLIHTPILNKKTQFDPVRDFIGVSWLATGPLVIVVHPSVPVRQVKELVALAKLHPGKLNYGSTGIGSVNHLLGEMFQNYTHTKIEHIPYKGGADAISSLLGGEVALVMTGIPPVVSLAKSGKLRVIVTTGHNKIMDMPQVQTMSEAGYPSMEFVIWYGIVAPQGTPKILVERLNAEIKKAMSDSVLSKRFVEQGVDPETNSMEQFAHIIHDDYDRWSKIIGSSGIRID